MRHFSLLMIVGSCIFICPLCETHLPKTTYFGQKTNQKYTVRITCNDILFTSLCHDTTGGFLELIINNIAMECSVCKLFVICIKPLWRLAIVTLYDVIPRLHTASCYLFSYIVRYQIVSRVFV